MATYLLTWNPARWNWVDLHDDILAIQTRGYLSGSWSSGATRRIVPGHRVFLMKLGKGPRHGLMASGWATSEVYPGEHWDEAARAKGKIAWHVDVDFDTILDPEVDIFPRAWLDQGIYTKINWKPRASGTTIPADVAAKLEQDWARFLNRSVPLGIIPVQQPQLSRYTAKAFIKKFDLAPMVFRASPRS